MQDETGPLTVEQIVWHRKFGVGTVAVPDDTAGMVGVEFATVGRKRVMRSFLSTRPFPAIEPAAFEPARRSGPALTIVAASTLAAGRATPRQEHVAGMIPAKNVTLLFGDGGTGKSLLALQLAFSTATGHPWIGMPTEEGRTLFLTAEDEVEEVHRRLESICLKTGYDLAEVAELHILSLAGKDALLATAEGRSGILRQTPLLGQLAAWIGQRKPALVVLDTLADLFGGEENVRSQARQFISILRGIAIEHGATIVLLGHPSLSGMTSGAGTSGNTAWSNSVRSRLYLERQVVREGERMAEPDPDVRVLRVMKANYGRVGTELRVRWQDGVFVPVENSIGGAGLVAAGLKAERVFLDLVATYTAEGRSVSPAPSAGYAPTVFAADARAEGLTKGALAKAMNRLFASGQIAVESYGPPSKLRQRIVVKEVRRYDAD